MKTNRLIKQWSSRSSWRSGDIGKGMKVTTDVQLNRLSTLRWDWWRSVELLQWSHLRWISGPYEGQPLNRKHVGDLWMGISQSLWQAVEAFTNEEGLMVCWSLHSYLLVYLWCSADGDLLWFLSWSLHTVAYLGVKVFILGVVNLWWCVSLVVVNIYLW